MSEPIEIKQIKDFRMALKDFEPMVKNPQFLRTGRKIGNFSLLPREAWANWLLCVTLQSIHGNGITFAEDFVGDGILLNKERKEWIRLEHVSALDVPSDDSALKNEERVLNAIQKKIDKGVEYALGKMLVAFIESAELWYPNRVGNKIHGKHNFVAVYCIGLLKSGRDGYQYSISQLEPSNSPTWIININFDFTDWSIQRIQ
ncbi:hypothetical protein IT409_02235 [Candidatus Falkowbacteria bacterium]|nr:hypothetical protein [Candidatus Falkowbacteria bacterium]